MPIKINTETNDSSTMGLKHAILIYDGQSKGVATLHDIHLDDATNAATIMPGQPLDVSRLKDVVLSVTSKRTKRSLEYLPDNILAMSDSKMVWWCKAHREAIFFNADKFGTDRKMNEFNGKEVWHPNLVFCAENGAGIRVFAVTQGVRPMPGVTLYRAPYWNTAATGSVCMGSVGFTRQTKPRIMCVEAMEEIQKAFFNSFFTHAIDGQDLVVHPKGMYGYWKRMSKEFLGIKFLTETNYKLEDLI